MPKDIAKTLPVIIAVVCFEESGNIIPFAPLTLTLLLVTCNTFAVPATDVLTFPPEVAISTLEVPFDIELPDPPLIPVN